MTDKVLCVVPVSGGKDSQLCLMLAIAFFGVRHVRALFCDTKWEHPWTYTHVALLRFLYGAVRLDTVNAGSVPEQIVKHRQFPLGGSRFCTEELKIWPTKRYLKALAEEQGSRIVSKKNGIEASGAGGFEVWYGMRSDESPDRRKRYRGKLDDTLYAPHEVLGKYPQYLSKLGVRFRLPILNFTERQVFAELNGMENPLYRVLGADGKPLFKRVGCFPCQASGDENMERSYAFDATGAARRVIIMKLADETGKSPWGTDAARARNTACALTCGE